MRRSSEKKIEGAPLSVQEREFNKTTADIKQVLKELGDRKKLLSETSDEYIAVSNKLAFIQQETNTAQTELSKTMADIDSFNKTKESLLEYIAGLEKRKELSDIEAFEYKTSLILRQETYKTDLEKERTALLNEKRELESGIVQTKMELEYLTSQVEKTKIELKNEKEFLQGLFVKESEVEREILANEDIAAGLKAQISLDSEEATKLLVFKKELITLVEKLTTEVAALKEKSIEAASDIEEKKSTMGRLFLREDLVKEQAHIIKDFYTKNGMKIPEGLNF